MHIIENDAFYEYIKKYDPHSEYYFAGEVEYHLLCDDKPYEGMRSHREALRFVFDSMVKDGTEDIPLVYDADKAEASSVDSETFFYCPNIIKTDYYGNAWYDADWEPDGGNIGTTVPYWYAVMEPVHSRRNKPEDFKKVNEVLFPNGIDGLDIYEWTTDWSDYFDDGHEWYGACCWSVYDKTLKIYVVMLVSATD